ncbi:tRNA nucleotidyltransferase (CCA-adding enzyme) [Noviherbaspirillum humi]|uniref:CCA-adding enzyme n=1 Tax=Noviherbaspirillum humi TaxID=1688639 RepID=A0A239CH58_9BURK|nr:multifunctional CCA addition/repair protein [Noviherbaspirillum humi]SNS18998.1 tRNA nucleotidyltransferase (CCA-adding enzyme) [Noviherbaspirillum humi]
MRSYIVGGAVRDELLGLPVQDHDHVVVGATPEEMMAAGYTPVGKDFPVFLHPSTHEEYALARTERKTAPGYKGFVFHADENVTLEQDLVRRDLTINAMAKAEDGSIIDPFNGRRDLQQRIFRHVSDAFAEDPVRILRLARFAARFTDFRVAPETHALMRRMAEEGEVDALVPERVWQEISRGLMEARPSRMIEVLRDCGALARILPELAALWRMPASAPQAAAGARLLCMLDDAAQAGLDLPQRFAVLTYDLSAGAVSPQEDAAAALVDAVCKRIKVPTDCRDLARITAREHRHVARAGTLSAEDKVALFERCDAFRKPQRFIDMLQAAACIHGGAQAAFPQRDDLTSALEAARGVDAGAVARQLAERVKEIPGAVHRARVAAVEAVAAQRQR